MYEHHDRRVRKTEAQLIKGLTKLMKTKSIKEITVKELADEVDINRSTFYLHYKDIYDMVDVIENDLAEGFLNALDELSTNRITKSSLRNFLIDIYKIIYSNSEICDVLLSDNGDIAFHNKLHKIIYHKTHNIIKNIMVSHSTESEIKIATCYIISGIIGIVETWLQNIELGTPEYMAELSCKLIEDGIYAFNINGKKFK